VFWPRDVEAETALATAAAEFGFKPLSKDERIARGSIERGVLVALRPAGMLLDGRPRARWEPVAGVDKYEVAFFAADGTRLWSTETNESRLDYPTDQPALERGQRYSWEVSCKGPLGDEDAQRSFTVASEQQRRAFEETWRAIEVNAPDELVDLLRAHFAIREKFYAEAEHAARAFFENNPDDRVGRETLFQVLELLGSSEANGLLEKRE